MISICIPAYKNDFFIRRLLKSVALQSFKDYEVIVTDDSPDNSVELACSEYMHEFSLSYYKNDVALGSPANWNFAISKAKGEWIKMMHHDDWFSQNNSLALFHEATSSNCDFIFSAFNEVDEEKIQHHTMTAVETKLLAASPYNLFKKNFIGHPSTTLMRNNRASWYDENLKWVVDFEFYIRYLNESPSFNYLNEPLINIGLSDSQITKTAFRNVDIEIPENIFLLNKIGESHLSNVFVCDYYWRLLRNMNIRSERELTKHVESVPASLKKMLKFQSRFHPKLLKMGVISKSLMFAFYASAKFD